jgi:hypothetical protein
VDPIAHQHDVGRALVLDLEHRALAGLVRLIQRLGDHAIQPRAFELVEPAPGDVDVARRVGEV